MWKYVNINAREKRLVMEGAPEFGAMIVADLAGEFAFMFRMMRILRFAIAWRL